MLALVRLVGNLCGVAVMMHRLGGRHIGTRPFEPVWKGVQVEDEDSNVSEASERPKIKKQESYRLCAPNSRKKWR